MLCARSILCIGLAITLASGCTKADTAERAEPAKPIMLASPGLVSLEQAIAAMGTDAPYRLVIRWPLLVKSGVMAMGDDIIPQDQRRTYEQFVAASGFDLSKRCSGVLVYGDRDLSKLERVTVVLGFNGVITGKVIDELMKLGEDDDDDDDDDDAPTFSQVVVLAQLSPEVRDKLIELSKKLDPGEKPVETETVGDDIVFAQPEGKGLSYLYLWQDGFVYGQLETTSAPPLVAAKTALAPILADLSKAAAAQGQPNDLAIEGRVSENGIVGTYSARIEKTVVADATITLRAADVARVKKALNQLPAVRANPDAKKSRELAEKWRELFEARNPVAASLLGKLLLDGMTINLKGRQVVVHVEADVEKLKALIRALTT